MKYALTVDCRRRVAMQDREHTAGFDRRGGDGRHCGRNRLGHNKNHRVGCERFFPTPGVRKSTSTLVDPVDPADPVATADQAVAGGGR